MILRIKKISKDSISLDTYKVLGNFLQLIQSQHIGYNSEYKQYASEDCIQDIKDYFNEKNITIYIFFNERTEEICGMAIIREDKDYNYHIVEIYICPSYRGKGIAKRFIKMIFKQCKEFVTLRVHLKNSKALRLYKGLGFTWLDESCLFGSRQMIWMNKKGSGRNA